MNGINENYSTPIQTRSKHLGLKRISSSVKEEVARKITTGSSNPTTIETPRLRLQSDVRVNYRNLERSKESKRETLTPGTPTTSNLEQRECVSTNCRPYRLSLSKRVREKMTKKRLEFHMANELEKEEEELKISQEQERQDNRELRANAKVSEKCHESVNSNFKVVVKEDKNTASIDIDAEEMSRDQLLAHIDKLRNELNAREQHERKVQDLQQAINIWKIGFNAALRDLQGKITPHYDNETLLEHLHIPNEMLKYIND